jgi:hypothetical protein
MKKLNKQIDEYSFDENENKIKKTNNNFFEEIDRYILNKEDRENFSNCYDNLVRF